MTKMTNVKALEFVLANCELPMDVTTKLENMKAQFEKKNSSKSASKSLTKTQKENITLKDAILNGLETEASYTVTEILKVVPELDGLSSQKVSALVRQLCISGDMVRSEDKGRAYFTLA